MSDIHTKRHRRCQGQVVRGYYSCTTWGTLGGLGLPGGTDT